MPGRLVFGVKGFLLAGLAVVRPEIIAPAEHAESLFHTLLIFCCKRKPEISLALMRSECVVAAQWGHYDPLVKPADISADIPHFSTLKCLV